MAASFSSPIWLEIACVIGFVFSSLFLLPLCESTDFKITNFVSEATNILYSGDAQPSSGAIDLNRVDIVRVGHAKYADAIQIWDSKTGKLSDFTTRFTFVIDTLNQSSYGDAFAFFLAPVGFEIPPNSAGQYIGLFNTTTYNSPQTHMIVVEFDTVANTWIDPPYQHVGININSLGSANFTAWNASLHSGNAADAAVSYNAKTQMLSLSVRYGAAENQSENNIDLSYQVNLRDVLPEWVMIGFSGTTGLFTERHTIRYWEFSSSLKTKQTSEDNSNKTKLAVGLAVPLCVLVVGGIVAYAIFWRRGRKTRQEQEDIVALTSINDDFESGTGPKRFSFKDLALATNNFSDDLKLGEGGFGCVYKGYLSREDTMVAVKKISQGSKQGKKEYMTEVKIISSLRHRNLVQLIGWCHEETQLLLMYEFMPNGSLDSHIFFRKSLIKWDVRYNIATGLASALLYLHEECEQCVVHRDIKASNIMLDSGFQAKLGDFGLARLMDHEMGVKTTGLAGTLGYMAPEYAITGKASKESDVYSFGVVALEIACGKRVSDNVEPNSNLGFIEWVWSLLGKNELLFGVDPMLNNEFNAKEFECLMMVGLWCSHPDRSMRPSIRQAIQVLKFEGALPNLPTKMPVPVYSSAPYSSDVSSSYATMTNSSIDMVR